MNKHPLQDEDIIYIKDLTWSYHDKPLFTDVSAHIKKGKFISIIGPNGSGKTTLLKLCMRLLPLPRHSIYYPKGDAFHYTQKELAHLISYVPQQSRIEYEFTVFECVAMARYSYNNRFSPLSAEDAKIVEESIEALGLSHLKDRSSTELSGGEYQRMLIARALAQQSSVMVLDEPVSHLDIHHQVEILSLLKSLVETKGITIICVLHDLNAVSHYSDEVMLLDSGTIVAHASPVEVLRKELIESVYKVKLSVLYDSDQRRTIVTPQWKSLKD
jgi:iron complex transport system ATP-binding protein